MHLHIVIILLSITVVAANCLLILSIFQMTSYVKFTSPEILTAYVHQNITEADYHIVKLVHRIMLAYFMAWVLLKVIHVLTIFCALYALFKKKPTILKYYLYINVPNWILDLFVTAIAAALSSVWLKFVVLICILSEGYNLLAINTAYKNMTGKSKVIADEDLTSAENEIVVHSNDLTSPPPYQTISLQNTGNNEEPHCRTCTCTITPVLANSPKIQPVSRSSANDKTEQTEASPTEEDKELNFKDDTIIFDQNQLVVRNGDIVDKTKSLRAHNSNLNHNSTDVYNRVLKSRSKLDSDLRTPNIEENKDLAVIPIIYDENQLNVGTSPIIEDRPSPDNVIMDRDEK